MHNGELDSCHCNIPEPAEGNEGLGIFDKVFFYKQALLKTFHLDMISTPV
jgi:hypothetical protein